MEKCKNFYNIDAAYKDTRVVICHKDKEPIEFNIDILIKRKQPDVFSPNMFNLLNKYVDYKGEAFKDALYEEYRKIDDFFMDILTGNVRLEEPPYDLVDGVLNMFDFEDVKEFLRKFNLVNMDIGLKESFDSTMEINKEGTRVQTYLKEDYLELVALLTIIKSVLGPLGHLISLLQQTIPETYHTYYIYLILLRHPIAKLEPFEKLRGYVHKLVQNVESNKRELSLRLIEKNIDVETLPDIILSGALFNNILLGDETKDEKKKNLVTKFYSFVSSRLNLKNTPNSKIKLKQEFKTCPEDGEDTESVVEAYRIPTELSMGSIEEFKFACDDPITLYRWLKPEGDLNMELFNIFKHAIENIPARNIAEVNIKLAFIIAKNVIDPRIYRYVELKHVRNVMTVAATVLWENDFKLLATILASSLAETDIAKVNYNIKIKFMEYHKDLLDKKFRLYMFNRNVKTGEVTKVINQADEFLGSITDKIIGNDYICTGLPEDMLEEATGSTNRLINIPNDMKIRLLEALVRMEEIVG